MWWVEDGDVGGIHSPYAVGKAHVADPGNTSFGFMRLMNWMTRQTSQMALLAMDDLHMPNRLVTC